MIAQIHAAPCLCPEVPEANLLGTVWHAGLHQQMLVVACRAACVRVYSLAADSFATECASAYSKIPTSHTTCIHAQPGAYLHFIWYPALPCQQPPSPSCCALEYLVLCSYHVLRAISGQNLPKCLMAALVHSHGPQSPTCQPDVHYTLGSGVQAFCGTDDLLRNRQRARNQWFWCNGARIGTGQ